MQNKHKYLVNGQLTDPSNMPNGYDSRAFLYADGFFESMLVVNNSIPLFDLHYRRIQESLSAYKITPKENLDSSVLKESLLSLANSSVLKTLHESDLRFIGPMKVEGNFFPRQTKLIGLQILKGMKQ